MTPDPRFIAELAATFGLEPATCARLVTEVLEHQNETVEEFIRRRHPELRRRGLKNDEIYRAILAEAGNRRFAAGPLSERQLRRIIYG